MLLLAVAAFVTSTVLIAREQSNTKTAYLREQRKAIEASRERAGAATSYAQARDAVNFFSRVAAGELANSPASADVRKEMLEAALDYYEGFLETRRLDRTASAELTEAQAYVSNILSELAAFANFDLMQTRARLLYEPTVQTALGLTPEQVTKVRSSDLGFPEAGGPGGFGPSAASAASAAWAASDAAGPRTSRRTSGR